MKEAALIEKLIKIEALFAGAATEGEDFRGSGATTYIITSSGAASQESSD